MIESLEPRRMLSLPAPWGAQGIQIHQDQATTDFPNLTGQGESVVIIDDGVDYTDPVLGGGFGRHHKVIAGYNFIDNTSNPYPTTGDPHGTSTAALAAGYGYVFEGHYYQGVAPGAHIIAISDLQPTSMDALNWVLAHRERYNIVAVEIRDFNYLAQRRQIQELNDDGVFIGRFSGNLGITLDAPSYLGVVQTGSVNSSNRVSAFTSRGPNMAMLAPGEDVVVAQTASDGAYVDLFDDGTSWATAQVVGAAALIKQVDSQFTPAEILSILQKSGTPVFDSASSLTYPILNLDAALKLAMKRRKQFGRAVKTGDSSLAPAAQGFVYGAPAGPFAALTSIPTTAPVENASLFGPESALAGQLNDPDASWM